ncbi:hypothetical protein EON80_28940 [bacterium]|nr:MAG: hypothetical protein EON80_28940 [bacterium]
MRSNLQLTVGVQALLVTFLGCGAALAQGKIATVVPGKSLGRVSLGMSPAQVHRLLGKPDKTLRLKNGLLDDLYKAKTTRPDGNSGAVTRDRVEVLYRGGRAVQLEATSPDFRTASGISTGSDVDALRASVYNWRLLQYSYPVDDGGWTNYYFWDGGRGLTFEFQGWQEGLLGSSRPTTLIVHGKGARVIADIGGVFESESRSLFPALAN